MSADNGMTIPEGEIMFDIHTKNKYWHYNFVNLQVSDNRGTPFTQIPLKGQYLERYVTHKYDHTCDDNGKEVACRFYKITVEAMQGGIEGASLLDWFIWEGLKADCQNRQ